MGTQIPTKQREALRARSGGQCERCGGRAAEMHHRRSRAVRDAHRHCLCVLVHLCGTCHHQQVHHQPAKARSEGFVVRRSVTEPAEVPFLHWTGHEVYARCDGQLVPVG